MLRSKNWTPPARTPPARPPARHGWSHNTTRLWRVYKKQKMLITRIFPFSHKIFYSIKDIFSIVNYAPNLNRFNSLQVLSDQTSMFLRLLKSNSIPDKPIIKWPFWYRVFSKTLWIIIIMKISQTRNFFPPQCFPCLQIQIAWLNWARHILFCCI